MKNLFIIALAILTLSGCRSLGFYGSYTYSFVGVSDYASLIRWCKAIPIRTV